MAKSFFCSFFFLLIPAHTLVGNLGRMSALCTQQWFGEMSDSPPTAMSRPDQLFSLVLHSGTSVPSPSPPLLANWYRSQGTAGGIAGCDTGTSLPG